MTVSVSINVTRLRELEEPDDEDEDVFDEDEKDGDEDEEDGGEDEEDGDEDGMKKRKAIVDSRTLNNQSYLRR